MPSLLIALLGGAQSAPDAPVAPTLPAPCDPYVEIVKALAWPVFGLIVAFILRRPLAAFATALGTRVTKLSVFKVELELVPAASAAVSTPLLDDIRSATTSATISDSSRMMLDQVQTGTQADFAMIAIGDGKEWLTSRLYIAAVMLERMRGVQMFVFVEKSPTTERRLIAVASVPHVRWALAQRYPWLEAAWTRSYLALFPATVAAGPTPLPPSAAFLPDPRTLAGQPPIIKSITGATEPYAARQLVSRYIDSLQQPPASPAPPGAPAPPIAPAPVAPAATGAEDWVVLSPTTRERARWVTRELLTELLPPDALRAWTDVFRDAPAARRTRAVLRRAAPFVALVEGPDREFVRLVNRRALLEDIATSLGEEPEGTTA
jgi:hypothetical protein